MNEAAEELNFERAKELRDHILQIDAVMEKQKITTTDTVDRDIFGFAVDKGWMCVQILYMRQGKLIERHASLFPYYGEADEDFLTFVTQYYSENPALPKEVFLPAWGAGQKQEEAGDPVGKAEHKAGFSDAESEEHEVAAKVEIKEALESWLKVKVHIPRRGLKKNMVDMACENAGLRLKKNSV